MDKERKERFVANGGWIETTRRYRPKTTKYALLAVFWTFPSLGALWILGQGWPDWLAAPSIPEALKRIRVEDWIAAGLLLIHVLLVGMAVYSARKEPIQGRRVLLPNTDFDPRKLY